MNIYQDLCKFLPFFPEFIFHYLVFCSKNLLLLKLCKLMWTKKGSAVLPIPALSGSEQAVIGQGQKAGNGAGQKPQNHADAAHLCVEAEIPIEAVQVLRAGHPHPLPEGAVSEVDDQGIKPVHRRRGIVIDKGQRILKDCRNDDGCKQEAQHTR